MKNALKNRASVAHDSSSQVRKRGQAALEYLTTYGWGFLVILVVIGGMAYFGYLSPSRYTPERCNTGVQLECSDYQLVSAASGGGNEQIKLVFLNNFGDNINITRVYLFNSTAGINTGGGVVVSDTSIRRGNTSAIFTFRLGSDASLSGVLLPKGDKISVPVIVTFMRNQSGATLHNVTGEIYAVVR